MALQTPYEGSNLLADPANALVPNVGGVRQASDHALVPLSNANYLGIPCQTRWHSQIFYDITTSLNIYITPPPGWAPPDVTNLSAYPPLQSFPAASQPAPFLLDNEFYFGFFVTAQAPGTWYANSWTLLYVLGLTAPVTGQIKLDCTIDFTHSML